MTVEDKLYQVQIILQSCAPNRDSNIYNRLWCAALWARHINDIPSMSVEMTRFALLQEMSLLSTASFCQSKAALYRLFFNCIIQEDYVKWRGPLFFRFVSVIVDEVDTVRDFGKMPTSCIEPLCYDQHFILETHFCKYSMPNLMYTPT